MSTELSGEQGEALGLPPLMVGDIIFTRDDSFVSRAIRHITLSEFSHIGMITGMYPNRISTVSAEWRGVEQRTFPRDWYGDIEIGRVIDATVEQRVAAAAFCVSQIGKEYDWRGLADFLTFRKLQAEKRWFCSELVYAAWRQAGEDFFAGRVDKAFVPPGLIYTSNDIEIIWKGAR